MTDPKDWKEIQRRIRMAITTLSILLEEMNTTHPQPNREEKGIEEDALFGDLTDEEWEELRTHGIHQ